MLLLRHPPTSLLRSRRHACSSKFGQQRARSVRGLAAASRVRVHATQTQQRTTETDEDLLYVGESFYEILGVSPSADSKTIKKAYLSLIKECHPDRSTFEATEFCVLLNDIYKTLSDPAKRATYDALTGFSDDSINPFVDTATERDNVFVDEFTCIGCRNCVNVCPSTFAIEDDYGRARVMRQGKDTPEKQQEAIDTCPVSCIHWVSAPQLSLLEAAMARMERIAVWSMGMSSAASNKDVFTEASLAWQRRQSELRTRRAAAAAAEAWATNTTYSTGAASSSKQQSGGPKQDWASWLNNISGGGAGGSTMYEQSAKQQARGQRQQAKQQAQAAGGGGGYNSADSDLVSDKEARSIAQLAAKAARASRTWRVVQEAQARARTMSPLYSLDITTSGSDSAGSDAEGW